MKSNLGFGGRGREKSRRLEFVRLCNHGEWSKPATKPLIGVRSVQLSWALKTRKKKKPSKAKKMLLPRKGAGGRKKIVPRVVAMRQRPNNQRRLEGRNSVITLEVERTGGETGRQTLKVVWTFFRISRLHKAERLGKPGTGCCSWRARRGKKNTTSVRL